VPGASTPSAGFIEIGDPANFVAWAPFSETDSARLRVGQTGTVLVDALPNLKMSCKVTYISPMATLVGGVSEFYVEASLSPPDTDLRNGYTATVNIDVAEADNVLTVPSEAIFSDASGTLQVDVWYQHAAYATNVTTGLIGSVLTQITSGLGAGQQVVLAPSGQLSLPLSSPA
jgi:macrolide-specific efflux system membrane fusion protein